MESLGKVGKVVDSTMVGKKVNFLGSKVGKKVVVGTGVRIGKVVARNVARKEADDKNL